MRHFARLIVIVLLFATNVAAQPDTTAIDAAFDNSLKAAATATDPSTARRNALKVYETSLAAMALPLDQQAKKLAQKCVAVADADFYAMYRYFLSDIKQPTMGPTRLALPAEIRELLQKHAQQTVNDHIAKQNGKPVAPLEQRLPPGVPWRTIASGKPLPTGGTPLPGTGFVGNKVPMNPGDFNTYIQGSWNVRIYSGVSSQYSETTWIFDIDGPGSVRVDARTKSPQTLRYWVTQQYSTYGGKWMKVHFDYASGRVELAQDGFFLTGSVKKGQASLKVEVYKAPDLDYERWGDDAKTDKQFEAAEYYYSQAILAKPSDGYFVKRAHVRHEVRRLNDAIADLSMALKLNPNNATALYNRAVTYAELNDLTKALADSDRTVYIAPRVGPYYHLRGQIHRRLGNRDAAIADFRSTLKYDPNHPKAKADLAGYGVAP